MNSMETMDITEDPAKWFDLNLDRSLLDSNFEGYKLSLDAFPQYKLDLTQQHQLDTGNLSDDNDMTSQKVMLFQHLKLIGLQNLIIVNQFDDSNLYYFDSQFRLVKIVYKNAQRAITPTNLQLNDLAISKSNRVNVTMKFISPTVAVIFDGYETIYMAEVAGQIDPTCPENWTQIFKFSTKNLEKFGVVCILKDAVLLDDKLHLLFMNVQEKVEPDSLGAFDTLINWLLFEKEEMTSIWNLKRVRRMNCFSSVPDYVALETNGLSVYVAGADFIKFEFDSVKGVELPATKKILKPMEQTEAKPIEKFYTWNQTVNEINLSVRILDTHKLHVKDLEISMRPEKLELLHQGKVIISDSMFATIKVDESTWSLNADAQLIEFILSKSVNEVWPVCLKDMEKFGQYKSEAKEDQMDIDIEADKRNQMITWEETQNLYRLEQQLEECDAIEDEPYRVSENGDKMIMFRRMDGEMHVATHKACINDNKFLFDVRLCPKKSPALCLRHDVDGILWQPHHIATDTPTTDSPWLTHLHTFLAFGYVQASKTNGKFRTCAPNCSYVCLADTNKHIYIYKSVPADTQLKNRKSGKLTTHIAKQYLISLENDEEIYGLYCASDYLVVLLSQSCFVYKINAD